MAKSPLKWELDAWQYWTPEAQQDWPIDTDSHVYLCRALDMVGKALFQTQWIGTETHEYPDINARHPISQTVFIHIEQPMATEYQREQIFSLLRDRFVGHPSMPQSPRAKFDPGLWRQGCHLAELEDARRREARKRAGLAMKVIRSAILNKVMGFGFREIPGGTLLKYEPHLSNFMGDSYWNGENLSPRIPFGQINIKAPFGDDPRQPEGIVDHRKHAWRFVFLDRKGLHRALQEIAPKSAPFEVKDGATPPLQPRQEAGQLGNSVRKQKGPDAARRAYLIQYSLWLLTEGGGINSAASNENTKTRFRSQLAAHMNEFYEGNYTAKSGNVRDYMDAAQEKYELGERIIEKPSF